MLCFAKDTSAGARSRFNIFGDNSRFSFIPLAETRVEPGTVREPNESPSPRAAYPADTACLLSECFSRYAHGEIAGLAQQPS